MVTELVGIGENQSLSVLSHNTNNHKHEYPHDSDIIVHVTGNPECDARQLRV